MISERCHRFKFVCLPLDGDDADEEGEDLAAPKVRMDYVLQEITVFPCTKQIAYIGRVGRAI